MANGNWHLAPAHCVTVRSTDGNFDAYRVTPAGECRGAIVVLHERLEPHIDLSVQSYTDWQKGLELYGGEHFDAEAARLSRSRTLIFFDRHLG